MQPRTAKLALFSVLILSIGMAIGMNLKPRQSASKSVSFRDFMLDVDAGKVEKVSIKGQKVSGVYRTDKEAFVTYAPAQIGTLATTLGAKGILVTR